MDTFQKGKADYVIELSTTARPCSGTVYPTGALLNSLISWNFEQGIWAYV